MREFIVRCKPDAVVPNRFEVKLQLVANTGSRSERAFTVAAQTAMECMKSLPALARGMESSGGTAPTESHKLGPASSTLAPATIPQNEADEEVIPE